MYHLTYLQAVVTGLVQGVTELFPVSSLGHNVLLPALIGGSWAKTLNVSAPGSPYLAFIVGLHVATAIAMIAFFWRDWLRIVRGFYTSLVERRVATPDQRLAWMIILGTIPVGVVGLLVQKEFTKVFAKPELAATFLAINGLILLASERMRRRKENREGGGMRPAGGPRPAFDGPAFDGPAFDGPAGARRAGLRSRASGRPAGRAAAGVLPAAAAAAVAGAGPALRAGRPAAARRRRAAWARRPGRAGRAPGSTRRAVRARRAAGAGRAVRARRAADARRAVRAGWTGRAAGAGSAVARPGPARRAVRAGPEGRAAAAAGRGAGLRAAGAVRAAAVGRPAGTGAGHLA